MRIQTGGASDAAELAVVRVRPGSKPPPIPALLMLPSVARTIIVAYRWRRQCVVSPFLYSVEKIEFAVGSSLACSCRLNAT